MGASSHLRHWRGGNIAISGAHGNVSCHRDRMGNMPAPPEHYTWEDVLGRGYELKITLNGHTFTLIQNGMAIIASVNGEQHRFVGCHENEIKQVLEEYRPGDWREPCLSR